MVHEWLGHAGVIYLCAMQFVVSSAPTLYKQYQTDLSSCQEVMIE